MDIPVFLQSMAANSLVLGVVCWIAKLWADKHLERLKTAHIREIEKERHESTLQLEQLRSDHAADIENVRGDISKVNDNLRSSLERNMLIFKTHFDLEFNHYKELWTECDEGFDVANRVLRLYQNVPTDEASELIGQECSIDQYNVCLASLNKTRKRRPFVEVAVYSTATDLMVGCLSIAEGYKERYPYWEIDNLDYKDLVNGTAKELSQLRLKYDQLAIEIAQRIKAMYVSEQY